MHIFKLLQMKNVFLSYFFVFSHRFVASSVFVVFSILLAAYFLLSSALPPHFHYPSPSSRTVAPCLIISTFFFKFLLHLVGAPQYLLLLPLASCPSAQFFLFHPSLHFTLPVNRQFSMSCRAKRAVTHRNTQ